MLSIIICHVTILFYEFRSTNCFSIIAFLLSSLAFIALCYLFFFSSHTLFISPQQNILCAHRIIANKLLVFQYLRALSELHF